MKPGRLTELGLQRLDLLCGFLYYRLERDSLIQAPILLMGFRSVTDSPALREHEAALGNLRHICKGLGTQAALRAAVARYNDRSAKENAFSGHFRINERTLSFAPVFDFPSDRLKLALTELDEQPLAAAHGIPLANPAKPMYINVSFDGEVRRYPVTGLPAKLPQPAQHRHQRTPGEPIDVLWSDLIAQAEEMDGIDREQFADRPGNWVSRLESTTLTTPTANGTLEEQHSIRLSGLKHLIGLPGAGKTTILVCLLRHLAMQGIRTAVFFPSIEVCRQYLEDLRRYGVNAGLLVGQGRETRQSHAQRLGESLATGDDLRGFARTSNAAHLFEGVCALPALTEAPPQAFSIGSRFCREILQQPDGKDRLSPHLCPAWQLCSLNRAARELPNALIWLGHIRSADTRVPAHTIDHDERYFDLIAHQFDVAIFDEADKAQQDLDMSGISQLRLSGYSSSFHHEVQRSTLQLLAAGSNARLQNLEFAQLSIETAEFEKLNIALIAAIHRLNDELRRTLEGLLLTPLRLIGDWLSPRRLSGLNPELEFRDAHARAKDALCFIWESAAVEAFQSRDTGTQDRIELGDEWRRVADAFQRPIEELRKDRTELRLRMARWLNASSLQVREEVETQLVQQLAPYARDSDAPSAQLLVRLLVAVTFTVLAYRRLSPRLNALSQDGVLPPVRVDERCSDALLLASPENLLGSLSGVRFFSTRRGAGPDGDLHDIQLQYVVFSGAPRALLYHLHEWRTDATGRRYGPAVLLTSATSYLPPSPSFHIDAEPDYLLHRKDASAPASRSRYAFRPIDDPDAVGSGYLRFSGERSETTRMRNLEKMAAALLQGGPSASQLTQDCKVFDVRDGIGRKAAFVVNSYDQSQRLKRFIDQRFPAWRERVVAVVKDIPQDSAPGGYVTPARVEALGDTPDWDVLIFPMGALGRGTNVVFSSGPRQRDATIGTLYFLTRPHPSPDDLSLLVSIGAQATQAFNRRRLDDFSTLEELSNTFLAARRRVYSEVGRLLRHPLYARSLGDLFKPFTANMAVSLLQTIGRAMRNGCPVQCFFVDRAWAERSSRGEPDDSTSSMLVQLRELLEQGVQSDDARTSVLYRELYSAFLEPLSCIDNVLTNSHPSSVKEGEADEWHENPFWQADQPL